VQRLARAKATPTWNIGQWNTAHFVCEVIIGRHHQRDACIVPHRTASHRTAPHRIASLLLLPLADAMLLMPCAAAVIRHNHAGPYVSSDQHEWHSFPHGREAWQGLTAVTKSGQVRYCHP
jgi:hypothetical protein